MRYGRGDYLLLSPFGGTGCNGEKAQAYLELMSDFIDDAIGLYHERGNMGLDRTIDITAEHLTSDRVEVVQPQC